MLKLRRKILPSDFNLVNGKYEQKIKAGPPGQTQFRAVNNSHLNHKHYQSMSRTQCLHYLATWKKEIQPTFFPTPSTRELAATTTPDVLLYNKAWTQWIQKDPDVIYFGEIIKPKKIKEDPDMPPPKRVRYPEPSNENLTISHTTDGYPSISKE